MVERRRFELGRADPLPCDVEGVVGTSVQAPVAVLVDRRPVPVRPHAGKTAPVGLEIAGVVAPDPARHSGPGPGADELAHLLPQRGSLGREDVHRLPEGGKAERARLGRRHRSDREEAGADLGAAGDVDDRDPSPARRVLVQPVVRAGIPGLAGGGDRSQRGEVGLGLALRDQRPDERRRDAEHRHALGLDEAPDPVVGPVGRAFHVHDGRAERAGADHRPRPHDPAHVCREEDAIASADVRLVGGFAGDREEEPALDVNGSFRSSRCARGVGEEVGLLCGDFERSKSPFPQRHAPGTIAATPFDDVFHRRRRATGLLDRFPHLRLPPAAVRPVGRDDNPCAGVLEPLRDRGGAEAREDRHLDRAEVRAGVRDDGDLRAHRQIDRDSVAGLNAQRGEALGEPRDLERQLAERPFAALTVLAGEDRGHRVGRALRPDVDAGCRQVQARSFEPGRPRDPARVVQDALPRHRQCELEIVHDRAPEPIRLLDREPVQRGVVRTAERAGQPDDVRLLELLRGRLPRERRLTGDHASIIAERAAPDRGTSPAAAPGTILLRRRPLGDAPLVVTLRPSHGLRWCTFASRWRALASPGVQRASWQHFKSHVPKSQVARSSDSVLGSLHSSSAQRSPQRGRRITLLATSLKQPPP